MFYLLPISVKTLICLHLHLFHFRFHATCFPLVSWSISAAFSFISAILRQMTSLTSADLSSVSDIFSAILLEASHHTSDPLLGPVTCNPAQTQTYSTLLVRLRLQSITITVSTAPLSQEPSHFFHQVPHTSAIIGIGSSVLAAISYWIQIICFRFD